MSKEDVEFLEKVMREGIIDEGERMKTILKDLTDSLEMLLGANITGDGEHKQEEKRKELDEDEMLELMEELRDIVEQIDYARAFMAMGGIPFLLGCATYYAARGSPNMPKSIRKAALGVLSTMCQNNPPVQLSLLEHGHMPQLIQLFFDYTPGNEAGNDGDDSIREKAVQALSASTRGHAMAEHIFCQNEQGKVMLHLGLGMQHKSQRPSAQLRKRSLFLLRALLTADEASAERHAKFEDIVSFICTHGIDEKWEDDAEIREMSLVMLSQILTHKSSNSNESGPSGLSKVILQHKTHIGNLGVERIAAIRDMEEGTDEREYASIELEAWESMLVALAESK